MFLWRFNASGLWQGEGAGGQAMIGMLRCIFTATRGLQKGHSCCLHMAAPKPGTTTATNTACAAFEGSLGCRSQFVAPDPK